MSQQDLLIIMLGMALITYLLRLSFFMLQERVQLPALFRQMLRYAPAAVLLALVAPAVLIRQGTLAAGPGNERLWAALAAAAVAWTTRNTVLTIVVGMLALWFLQALGV